MVKTWSSQQISKIEAHLDAIAQSDGFANAPRLMSLLRYLVDCEVRGEGSSINQTRIALEVMGRGSAFDPSVDSSVRVEAGRLRSKLREYYATEEQSDAVQLLLPKGRYNPEIRVDAPQPSTDDGECAPVQEVRFLKTSDSTTIAYASSGQGPTLLKAANWLSHLEFDLVSPVWRHWWRDLSRRYRLIRYDERGCGLSDWDVERFDVDAWVADLEAVAATLDDQPFALLGISQGAAVAISYAVRHPERVSHLILYGGFAQGRLKRSTSAEQVEETALLRSMMRVGWGQQHSAFRKIFASYFVPDASLEQIDAFDALQRASTSPENAVRFFDAFNEVDVLDLASKVRVPTLVLHARNEVEIPMEQGRLLAATIPGARLVSLESGNHILGEGEPAWADFLAELERFVEPNRGA